MDSQDKLVQAGIDAMTSRPSEHMYWIDDDGYIAYGTGDDYITVAEIIKPEHIEPLTRLIASAPETKRQHDALLEVLKGDSINEAIWELSKPANCDYERVLRILKLKRKQIETAIELVEKG